MRINWYNTNEMYKISYGTMVTRWKDCKVLQILEQVCSSQSMKHLELLSWVCNAGTKKDLMRFLQESGN